MPTWSTEPAKLLIKYEFANILNLATTEQKSTAKMLYFCCSVRSKDLVLLKLDQDNYIM